MPIPISPELPLEDLAATTLATDSDIDLKVACEPAASGARGATINRGVTSTGASTSASADCPNYEDRHIMSASLASLAQPLSSFAAAHSRP
jgi:hypothetical protein